MKGQYCPRATVYKEICPRGQGYCQREDKATVSGRTRLRQREGKATSAGGQGYVSGSWRRFRERQTKVRNVSRVDESQTGKGAGKSRAEG